MIVFLRHRINTGETSGNNIHLSGTIVILVQSILRIQLLAVILIRLLVCKGTLGERHTIRIIVSHLDNGSIRLGHNTVVTQMILKIEVIDTIIDIATIYQDTFQRTILINHIPNVVGSLLRR